MRKKKKLRAVHDDDLEMVMEKLGIASKFRAGKLKCAFCGDVLTLDNLHSIFPDSGSIKLVCSKPECIKQLMARLEEKQYGR